METIPFSELGLPAHLLDAVAQLGYERPSPIQAMAIPAALAGRDLVGLSQTGSGKTAAFALPALARIDAQARHAQVLILCPTRELAVQVCEEVHRLGSQMPELRAVPVYGGAPIDRQIRSLREGAQLVVGTPGRLLDHLRRGTFDPGRIRLTILDEADRMLDMGFREEMEELLAAMPADRQTLFFSATMNRQVERLIQSFGRNPETIQIEQKAKTVSTIDQSYYEVRSRSKVEVLSRLLDIDPPRLGIVFCNTKREVDECTESLLARGYAADRLHGDITQQMRERVLKRFRDGTVELLVATDVAARGLDVDDVDVVFNYDLPHDPEDYVHRIGRTGRAGRSGRAISFVFGRDIYRLQNIERYTRQIIRRERIPSQEQVEGRRADALFESLKERLEGGNYEVHQDYIDRLLEQGHTPTDIAGALFTMLREAFGREKTEAIAEDREPAKPERPARREQGERGERPAPRERAERPERGERFERPERGARPEVSLPAGMTRLFMSLGKTHGVLAGEIAGMLYREAALPDATLGRITLFPKHTLVDVPSEFAEQVIKAANRSKLRGRPVRMDYDRGPGPRG